MTRRRQTNRTIPDHVSRRIEDAGLESYGVIAEIARGGMSTIYLGEDRATGERAATQARDGYHRGRRRSGPPPPRQAGAAQARRPPRADGVRCAEQTSHGVPYLVM